MSHFPSHFEASLRKPSPTVQTAWAFWPWPVHHSATLLGLTRFVRRHKLPLLPVSLGSDGTHPERRVTGHVMAGHGVCKPQELPRIFSRASETDPPGRDFVHLPASSPRTIYLPHDLHVDSYGVTIQWHPMHSIPKFTARHQSDLTLPKWPPWTWAKTSRQHGSSTNGSGDGCPI